MMQFNNRELFIRWYAWSLTYKDCDPAIWMANYIFDRFEFNIEQKYWLCWLYGNTYYYPTSFILWNEFPDYFLCSIDRITDWNTKYYKILRYQTDTKYNKGHLPTMFSSYKSVIGDKQQVKFESLLGDNEVDSFDNVYNYVSKSFYKFGRYTTWFYLQSLKHCCNLQINPKNLLLSDYSGSRSHRNGLLYALDKQDKIDVNLTKNEYEYLEAEAAAILEEMKSRFPNLKTQIDPFTMETCLCSFKKIFRESNGRYLGYYLDRQSEEIIKCMGDSWFGIDWDVLWQARYESLDSRICDVSQIKKEKFDNFVKYKKIDRLDWLFNDIETNRIGLENFYE